MRAMQDRIQSSFDRQSLMATLGARLARVAPGAVEITVPLAPHVLQQQGLAHGGLTFSIGDSAAGYSALTTLSEEMEVVTSEMKIHYLAAPKGVTLIARGRVVKPGRRLIVVAADVHAVDAEGAERHVALLTGTMIPVPTG
ncbi:PaaI family thioesterase [Roseivivax sp. GX 12232]|nr:PaaI family thioesterase [Roseivivax sp. GX 12232]MCE0505732.1 PaaI family thioesterase [Roseivivax sp. GX 12232]